MALRWLASVVFSAHSARDCRRMLPTTRSLALVAALATVPAWPHAQAPAPLSIARQGYLFAGGTYSLVNGRRVLSGQLYAEFQIPAGQTRPWPIVMVHGGGQSGTNFTGTPDGREGWAQFFLRQGYAVYVVDQPGRGRAAYEGSVYGPATQLNLDTIERRFIAPERFALWPQARLHTQWPGQGVQGDAAFDQFLASQLPSIQDFARQQTLNRDALLALLGQIGPAVLLTHSQSGAFGWPVADVRPDLVKAIVAVEPNGPPFFAVENVPAPEWFRDAPTAVNVWGITAVPLAYDPPVANPSELSIVREDRPDAPDLVRCWLQRAPARQLPKLAGVPTLVLTAEASYHAPYDHCTVKYLRQAGVRPTWIRLADAGIRGNGHMMMLEKNNHEIAALIARWLAGAMPAAAGASSAQTNPRYVRFEGVPSSVKGALYMPDGAQPPHVGILVMHRTSNFMNALACTELSRRGFVVLCMNPRSDNNEAAVRFETIPLDVAAGVRLLKRQPGITRIVLWGWSGGGATMTLYQSIAENGPSVCQGSDKLVQCGSELKGLAPADGLILVDAHPGNPVNALRSLNPAVTDERRPDRLDPALDPFNPRNGYNPRGASSYSEEFKRRYFAGQAARMNRLIDLARERQARMRQGGSLYPDDEPFVVPRGAGARLMQLDPRIHHATREPRKLLRNDGTIATQIVESVRVAAPQLAAENASFNGGALFLTIRSFLSANAVRARDSMDEIDYCSSNNPPPCHLPRIRVPLLVAAMGAHYFIRDNERHFEMAASPDKDFVVVEGAEHDQTPCTACESVPGQYSNSVANFYDYVAAWIRRRFE